MYIYVYMYIYIYSLQRPAVAFPLSHFSTFPNVAWRCFALAPAAQVCFLMLQPCIVAAWHAQAADQFNDAACVRDSVPGGDRPIDQSDDELVDLGAIWRQTIGRDARFFWLRRGGRQDGRFMKALAELLDHHGRVQACIEFFFQNNAGVLVFSKYNHRLGLRSSCLDEGPIPILNTSINALSCPTEVHAYAIDLQLQAERDVVRGEELAAQLVSLNWDISIVHCKCQPQHYVGVVCAWCTKHLRPRNVQNGLYIYMCLET